MPKLKDECERDARREIIRHSLANQGCGNYVATLAKRWEIAERTVRSRMKNPEKITVEELRLVRLNDDELLKFVKR